MSDHYYIPASVTPPAGSGALGPVPRRPPAERRRLARRWGAVVLIAALVVLGLNWHSIDHRHRSVDAGFVHYTGDPISTPHHASVLLPWGRLQLATSDPRTRLPSDVASEVGGDVRPPGGGRFVGVVWHPGGDDTALQPPVSVSPARGSVTEVSLVTGGHTYPLAPSLLHTYCPVDVCLGPYSDNEAWLAVDGSADGVSLAVTYAGVTQTVDMGTGRVDRGAAAGLTAATTRQPACGTPTWAHGFRGRGATCSAVVTRSVWVSGLGWAPAGREWLAASVAVERPDSLTHRTGGSTATFYASGLSASLSFDLDGARPVASQPTGAEDGSLPSSGPAPDTRAVTVAYSVPTSAAGAPLVVHATWTLDPGGSRTVPTRATSHATATWTVAV